MFDINRETMDITMHRGDTGAFKVHAARESGAAWTEYDRMIFTVTDMNGLVRMQRYYRLDTGRVVDFGDGVAEIEFHNDDTDKWSPGQYTTELRFVVLPVWDDANIPEDDVVDVHADTPRIIEGGVVRTKIQATITLRGVLAEV